MAVIGLGHTIGKNSQGQNAQRVLIDNQPILVSETTKGPVNHFYDSASVVPVASETLINSFTVPVGKAFDLLLCTCSGNNIARFIVKVNNQVVMVKRTWWTNFNVDFDFKEKKLIASDKVEIFVENNGSTSEFFESTITGGLYDI
jgi:hypothetical protein